MQQDLRKLTSFIFVLGASLSMAACSQPAIPGSEDALATEQGPEQSTWALTGVRQIDQQLLVTFRVSTANGDRDNLGFDVDEISLVDDASSIRYRLLQGDDGLPLASGAETKRLVIPAQKDSPVWLKFPMPTPETRTVSIALPRTGTFDGIPVD